MMRKAVPSAIVFALALAAAPARADAVDEAFARGTEAAARNDWPAAVAEFEIASGRLPQRNALISYNLGTAYAHLGELGRASYHLRRAIDWQGDPTADVLEAARANLAAVRRQAELEATRSGAKIDRPQTTWDLFIEGIQATWVAWVSLSCGILFAGALLVHRRWLRHQTRHAGVSRALLIVLGVIYSLLGGMHGWAVQASSTAPAGLVLSTVDAREGPGRHRSVTFALQAGAEVRVLDRSPGWNRVQLPGGLVGWVPDHTVAELAAVRAPGPRGGGPQAAALAAGAVLERDDRDRSVDP